MLLAQTAKSGRFGLLFLLLLLCGCSDDQPEAPSEKTKSDVQKAASEKENAGEAEGEKPVAKGEKAAPVLMPPSALPEPVKPGAMEVRVGAPPLLAQFKQGTVIPLAVKRDEEWKVAQVVTLDDMPEGDRGKDAQPEVLQNWWNRLDIQNGDVFLLQGDRGADGVLTVQKKLAAADRGGCVGLVVALPGKTRWTKEPRGVNENVWAFRGPWKPREPTFSRKLNDEEKKSLREMLKIARTAALSQLPPQPKGASQTECDSFGPPKCQSRTAYPLVFDLEGDDLPEVMCTVQVRSRNKNTTTSIEQRYLFNLSEGRVWLMGQWGGKAADARDSGSRKLGGLIDLTGDGRLEVIMSRTMNETENWEIFQANAEAPGEWRSILKTAFEGC